MGDVRLGQTKAKRRSRSCSPSQTVIRSRWRIEDSDLGQANDADGEPYEELLVFQAARGGRMDPPIIQFVGGLAQTDYVACRTGGPLPCRIRDGLCRLTS